MLLYMEKCYTLKKGKGNPKCEETEHCYWDKKKRCQPKKTAAASGRKNITMKLDRIMEDLEFIKTELVGLRKTQKNTSANQMPNTPNFSPIGKQNTLQNISPFATEDQDEDEDDDENLQYEEENLDTPSAMSPTEKIIAAKGNNNNGNNRNKTASPGAINALMARNNNNNNGNNNSKKRNNNGNKTASPGAINELVARNNNNNNGNNTLKNKNKNGNK